ncbi:hypothetical protein L484_027641 [Morus notabilis]|uniref:Uncharacterized protein n=1 Tax=Morus notabilis TaxID=981085 RepID=W9RMX4_9ROSA|nr:hypothetical protein L484_027641 [Morus notabilis]
MGGGDAITKPELPSLSLSLLLSRRFRFDSKSALQSPPPPPPLSSSSSSISRFSKRSPRP